MLQIAGMIIRYGASLQIAKAGTYDEVVGSEQVSLGPLTLKRYGALITVSRFSD